MDAMIAKPAKRRARDPEATRADILAAARKLLAENGPDGLSLSEVAQLAKVNRGTAYQHFATRENLIEATIASVSEILLQSVYGQDDRKVEDIDQVDLTERLASFAMDNPDLCRVWLLQVLASPDPSQDPFWRKYLDSLGQFSRTELAQPGIDTEVLSIIVLAGTFLWPVWAHVGKLDGQQRQQTADRFTRELLRLSMHGSLVPEKLPAIAERLQRKA